MYYQTYMKNYYLKNKEKIKKQSNEWRAKNPDKVRMVQSRYRKKRKEMGTMEDWKKPEAILLKKSPELITRQKENSRSNQGRTKYYEWPENFNEFHNLKKRILEGV
jgi:hypothetical protein